MSIKTAKQRDKTASNFTFHWDTSDAPKGKALVVRKKVVAKVKPKPLITSTEKPLALLKGKSTFDKPSKPTAKTSETVKPAVPTKPTKPIIRTSASSVVIEKSTVPNDKHVKLSANLGLIKRKNKKDKALAKQQQNSKVQTENDSTSNSEVHITQSKPANAETNYNLFNVKPKNIYVNTTKGKSVSEKLFGSSATFDNMGIHPHIVSNLNKHGFKQPTNVQMKSIPVILSGKNTLVRSQTGSGKTIAYAVPIIEALQGIQPRLKRSDGVQAIIVVPTRELAMQTHELFTKLNTFQWIVVGHLCGGESRKSEKDRIRKGINVLIGTPGRLLDHVLHTHAMKMNNVRCLVLDEADRLLDMGFRKDIVSLVEALDQHDNQGYDPMKILRSGKAPDEEQDEPIEEQKNEEGKEIKSEPPLRTIGSTMRQNVMLSATLTKEVSELASFTMKEHTYIDALDMTSNAVADSYVIPDTVQQEFIMTHAKHRLFTLAAVLLAKTRMRDKCKLFVFMASTQMVDYHYELFKKCLARMPLTRGSVNYGNVPLIAQDEDDDEEDELDEEVMDAELFKLHGSMDQKARKEVFKGFRTCKKGILICTDVVARGIDVPAADCIIQYTGPQQDEDYLHRVGRTGRAGKTGSAIIFLTHEEQDYIDHLRQHRVFLTKRDQDEYLKELMVVMQQPNVEEAATALQRRFEAAVEKDKALGRLACFAYSSWSRFYNSYPAKMREHFDFKRANLGHYVTSFALRQTPSAVAGAVRGQLSKQQQQQPPPKLNKKLANHSDNVELQKSSQQQSGMKRKAPKSLGLVTSEFSSGLEPRKKKPKRQAS